MPHVEGGPFGQQDLAHSPVMHPASEVSAQDLETIRSAMQERSEREGRMIDLGTLSDGTDPAIWQGGASLKKRIESGDLTEERVGECFGMLGRFFVPVTIGAPRRCVEDRTVKGYDPSDPRWVAMPLGPQFQGGTVDEAYAVRLVKTMDGEPVEDATIEADVAEAIERPSQFTPGDHGDDHTPAPKVGCGSADTAELKNKRLATEPKVKEAVVAKTDAILSLDNEQVPEGFYDDLVVSADELAKRAPAYFASMQAAFAKLRENNQNSVPTVTGAHLPGSLTLNYVRGTTFHTSEYNHATNGDLYNFGLDVWDVIDEYSPEVAAAILAQAVNTLTDLTDGSMRLFGRVAADKEPQAA